MQSKDDYYEILGITKNALKDEIKRAYRCKSLSLHPDRPGGDAHKFNQLTTAYEYLCSNLQQTTVQPTQQTQPVLVHQQSTRQISVLSLTIVKTVTITFEQSYFGVNYPIKIDRLIFESDQSVNETETVYCKISQGVDSGEIIIIPTKGNVNILTGQKGDIKIIINVAPDDILHFTRSGMDLFYTHNLPLKDALCGFSFTIKHINGTSLQIVNTNVIKPGFVKKIAGRGFIRDEFVGNLIITFNIVFPNELSPDIIAKLKQINF